MYIYNLQENKLTFDNYYKKERCDASLNKLSMYEYYRMFTWKRMLETRG